MRRQTGGAKGQSKQQQKGIVEKREEEEEILCDMRGMLSFMILWLLSMRPMYGQELASEIGKRKGEKPNPGTIYPALKLLSKRRFVRSHLEGRNTVYELTELGELCLERSTEHFRKAFGEILA